MLNFLEATRQYSSGTFEFGEVVDLEYVSDGEEKPAAVAPDDPEAPTEDELTYQDIQYTGYIFVRLFTNSVIVKASYIVPLGGNSMFMGGMPERGSICFMVNMKGDETGSGFGARVSPNSPTRNHVLRNYTGSRKSCTEEEEIKNPCAYWCRGVFNSYASWRELFTGGRKKQLDLSFF